MFIPPTLFPAAYANIVASSRGSSASRTFILVSPDVDAICAARLLVEMLRIDHVASTVIPVGSWGELEKVQERLASEEVRSLVLLNLGALVDLNSYFANLNLASATSSSSTQPEILIHVIDSHRPINLKNLFSSTDYSRGYFDLRRRRGRDQNEEERLEGIRRTGGRTEGEGIAVVIWSDEDGDEGREAEREAFEALEYEPDSDSESDSDEEVPLGRRRGQSSDEEDEDGSPGNGKRQRVDKNRGLSKILRRRYRAKLDRYYSSGTFSGQSVAGQIFLLAVLRGKADEDAVWLAILGLTHQFTTTQIDRTRYIAHSALLAEEVARLTSSSVSSAAESVSTGPNDRSIHASEELRFCLTRHWNLFDAIYHSGYVAGKLKLWKERGRKNLQGFLAKMGFSLQQCQQTYAHMDVDLKLSLFSSVETLAPEYGLFDLTFPSFIRKNGYRIDLSASDVIEAVGSLLEVATGIRLDFGGVSAVGGGGSGAAGVGMGLHGAGGGREEWKAEGMSRWIEGVEGAPDKSIPSLAGNTADGGVAEEEGEEERRKEKQESDWATRNFWLAWDSLDNDTSLLRSALPLSMALHRAVIRQGTYMLDKQAIKTTRSYRLAVFDEGPDLAVFRHPASLVRLASWLVDAVREMVGQAAGGAAKKTLPFVLASLNEKNDAFLVVGIVGAVEYGDVRKNSFGLAFQEAASRSGARTRHNAFEASVVEVRKDDLQKFLLLLPLL